MAEIRIIMKSLLNKLGWIKTVDYNSVKFRKIKENKDVYKLSVDEMNEILCKPQK